MGNPINSTKSSASKPVSTPSSSTEPNVGKLGDWENIQLTDAGTDEVPISIKQTDSVPDAKTMTDVARRTNPVVRFFRALVNLLRNCLRTPTTSHTESDRANSPMMKQPTMVVDLIEGAQHDSTKQSTLPTLFLIDSLLHKAKTIQPSIAQIKRTSNKELVGNLGSRDNMLHSAVVAMTSMEQIPPDGVKQLLAVSYPDKSDQQRQSLEDNVKNGASMLEKLNNARYDLDDATSILSNLGKQTNSVTSHVNPYTERAKDENFSKGGSESEDMRMRAWISNAFSLGERVTQIIETSVLGQAVDQLVAHPRGYEETSV